MTLMLSAMAARGLSEGLALDIARNFLRRQSGLVEKLRRRQHPDRIAEWTLEFEQWRFLAPRGSMPLDISNQVVGNVARIPLLSTFKDRHLQYAAIIHSALSAWLELRKQPSLSGVAGVSREFAEPCDRLIDHSDRRSVLILVNGRAFLLEAIDDGRAASVGRLTRAIAEIEAATFNRRPTALPVVTALPKADAMRQIRLARRTHAPAMKAIQNALMVFSFNCNLTDGSGLPDSIRGLSGLGHDRWFGKTNLFADGRGCLGLCIDHAVADGTAIARYVAHINRQLAALAAGNEALQSAGGSPCPVAALPSMPDALERGWRREVQRYRDRVGKLRTASRQIHLPTNRAPLLARALPLACQVAYFQINGEDRHVYVPVSRGHAVERGLDFVHASAPGTADVVRTLHDREYADPSVLNAALLWWKKTFFSLMHQQCGEKSLHHLHRLAGQHGLDQDIFFRALGYSNRRAFPQLCLSIVPGHRDMPAAVFPPSEGGWSVGMVYHEAGGNLCVTTRGDVAGRAATEIERAACRIVELAAA